MKTAPVIQRLPDEYLLLIGEIVTAWALQEVALRQIVFAMLDLDAKRGRTAVRSPRSKEVVDMISELALIDGFTVDMSGLSALNDVENRRNLVAHSIWLTSPNGIPMIQNLQGAWPKKGAIPRIKKRIQPEGIELTPDDLRDLLNAIRTITLNTNDVAQAISRRLASSSRKRPAPVDQQANPAPRDPPKQ